ncbi:MAG: DUF3352 domain-containing protein [Candidatus Coatesbacteria bacterium]|nr:DUF3352 domain-containing protein [Candidatus Coatesbacteria bacterium]
MKKAVVIILILLIAGIGISYYITQLCHQRTATSRAAKSDLEAPRLLTYIPDTAAFYASLSDIGALKTTIQSSDYFKTVSSTSLWQTSTSAMETQFREALKNPDLKAEAGPEPPDLGLLWDLVGEEVAVAFLPEQEPGAWAVAFLARVKNAQRLKKIANLITDTAKNKGFSLSDIEYKAESIKKAVEAPDKGEFYLCQTKALLVCSTRLETMKSVIDLISGDAQNSLASSANYRAVADKLKGGHFGEFFMRLDADMSSMFKSLANLEGLPMQAGTQGVPKMAGDSLSRLYVKDGLQFESYSVLDMERIDPKLAGFYKCKPNDLPLLSLVPQGSTFASALNCLDAKATYELAIDSVMTQNPMVAVMVSGFLTELEKKIGVSVAQDLLPAVGPDIAFYYKGLSFKQALSLPELGFACSSSSPERLYSAFPKIGDFLLSFAEDKAPEAKHVEDVYKGHAVHEIRLAMPIGEISLAASVIDKYFCIGFGREQVNAMIDCLAGEGPRLRDQPEYTLISASFPAESNQIMYLDFEALWQQIKSALELYAHGAGPESKDVFEFFDVLLKPMKTTFITTTYERPSENVVIGRGYGHVKIETQQNPTK